MKVLAIVVLVAILIGALAEYLRKRADPTHPHSPSSSSEQRQGWNQR